MAGIKKIIICDDEEDARKLLRQYLADFPQLEIVKECANGPEAVTSIDTLEPDLIFLDIQMPGLSGFQVLSKIVHVPQIIFSTAFDNYALKAFDNNAADYLLKPYTRERFSQAVNKVLLNTAGNTEGIKNLSEHLQKAYTAFPEKMLLENGNRMIAISMSDILWISADGDYTRLHTKEKSFLSNYGIGVLEHKLNPAMFTRVHRSAMINISYVKEVFREPNGYSIILQNGTTHKVGRNYVDAIKKISL